MAISKCHVDARLSVCLKRCSGVFAKNVFENTWRRQLFSSLIIGTHELEVFVYEKVDVL